jgi:hypothetical protein
VIWGAEMIDLTQPDFRLNLSTGIPGVAFHLSNIYDLAILADEDSFAGLPPRGPLGFWILKNRKRDIASEKQLLKRQEKFGKITTQPLGRGILLTIAEEDLQGLYRFAKKVLGKAKVA